MNRLALYAIAALALMSSANGFGIERGFLDLFMKAGSEDQCQDCLDFFGDLSSVLSGPDFGDRVRQGLEELCSEVGMDVQECADTSLLFIQTVLGALTADMPVRDICDTIAYCEPIPDTTSPAPSTAAPHF
ncbi:hypothetical protein LOTGIDRAFT_159844 [Lottia gigantea]|uniref:Saposin B-type domain-containing protein n=1 Tax=Lottia gigantea TaxID=225164 RepID=V4C4G9_LOTGI|nr:hypothetical protein LOTGIDRAFT_159844 [Lottia gigantea]ESO96434.1 hypothetical protein LOTGIDRAFT_159844 [Lottia gigantea]